VHFRRRPGPPELKNAYVKELGVFLVESYGQSELGGFLAMVTASEPPSAFLRSGPGLPDRETIVADENGKRTAVDQPGDYDPRRVMLSY